MKILWLCNAIIPVIANNIGQSVSASGGWIAGTYDGISKLDSISIFYCFPTNSNQSVSGCIGNLKYYGFSNKENLGNLFEYVLNYVEPDIIHVFGTEFSHSYYMVKACEKLNLLDHLVISIQGLVSYIAEYYDLFLPNCVVHGWSFRDIIKLDNVYFQKTKLMKRAIFEKKAIEKAKYVIGRTDWDNAATRTINRSIKYFRCNETLRNAFYENSWSLNNCDRHAIFVSQASYTIKGFHIMLQAFKEIKGQFPNAKLYTTGISPFSTDVIERMKMTYYQKHIGKLIKRFGIADSVFFLGKLSESEMCNRFLKSHVFVCCSLIENSSNSVGEAMLLGMPIVASYVGGVGSLLRHQNEGYLYQANAPYMLAHYIERIFENDSLAESLGDEAKKHAVLTHNPKNNLEGLIKIYNECSKSTKRIEL